MFYGARTADELFYLDFFERLGVKLVLATEDGGTRRSNAKAASPRRSKRRLKSASDRRGRHGLRLRPGADARGGGEARGRYDQPSQVSVERVMGCGLGGCYSCVVPVKHGDEHANLVRSCISGPVFDGAELVWD